MTGYGKMTPMGITMVRVVFGLVAGCALGRCGRLTRSGGLGERFLDELRQPFAMRSRELVRPR
jgi:hypothetical protein